MKSDPATTYRFRMSSLIVVLVFAIAIRLAYQASMVSFGGSFDNGSDSGKYLMAAHFLLATGTWPDTDRLPLYILFIAGVFKTVGSESLRAVVTIQAFLDALSVLGIALAAKALSPRLVLPAAIVATIIPNFIVHASYILQEAFFLPFLSWGLCALLWALRRQRPLLLLLLAGILFGITLWIRLTLFYFPLFLVPGLAIALRVQLRLPWKYCGPLSLVPAMAMFLVASPLLLHNYVVYGHAALSAQTGDHLLNWVYACLATPWPCTDRKSILGGLHIVIADYVRSVGSERLNPYDVAAYEQKLAIERILHLPWWQVAWGITWGAFRNVFQTGFYAVLHQFNQPPTFLSAMPGKTIFERISAFISVNRANGFMWLWTLSQITLIFSRIAQAFGAITGLARAEYRGQTILLLVTIAYILALNGPIADPKYRIPCEPSLIILLALGLINSATLICGRARLFGRIMDWLGAKPETVG